MINHGLTVEDADRLLDPVIEFPEIDSAFERVRPITDFRKDDNEARILYICRRVKFPREEEGAAAAAAVSQKDENDSLYILKLLAGGLTTPVPGPSEHTAAELQALQKFADTKTPSCPHLVSWKKEVQGSDGPMPGGYLAYVLMTLMPGRDLMELKFWSMAEAQRDEIRCAFLPAIKSVWSLGFEPYDCALRNILWEAGTKTISIVDFEHWRPTTTDPINMNERAEMQRWGIVQKPAHASHWEAFFEAEGLTRKGEI